jgi:hypothetical protein
MKLNYTFYRFEGESNLMILLMYAIECNTGEKRNTLMVMD